jgi:hypothetical protein
MKMNGYAVPTQVNTMDNSGFGKGTASGYGWRSSQLGYGFGYSWGYASGAGWVCRDGEAWGWGDGRASDEVWGGEGSGKGTASGAGWKYGLGNGYAVGWEDEWVCSTDTSEYHG